MKKVKYLIIGLFFLTFFSFQFPGQAMAAASLTLSPTSKTVGIGQSFAVSVILNTGGANTDATDVILNYDASKLTLIGATLGSLYENSLVNNTSVAGKVTLSAASVPGSYFSGTGTFATVTFQGKALGNAAVSFNFTANATTDCNVAYAGSDILGSVFNASYTVVPAGSITETPQEPTGLPTARPTLPNSGGLTPTVTLSLFGMFFLALGALAFLF